MVEITRHKGKGSKITEGPPVRQFPPDLKPYLDGSAKAINRHLRKTDAYEANKGDWSIEHMKRGMDDPKKSSPKPGIGEFLNPLSSPPGDEREGPTWGEFLNPLSPPPKRKKKSK